MLPEPLKPDDPRVEHKFLTIPGTGIRYHYMLGRPATTPTQTILLIHGFPDLAMGWRYQIPYLMSLNLQVIVPDMLGYGQTSAPEAKEEYTYKKMCAHMVAIIRDVVPGDSKVLLGGHDWGGYTAWRLAMWYPDLFLGVFSLAVHFTPPTREPVRLDDLVKRLPSLRYQQQLSGPQLEKDLDFL
jgi:soluble epoxide hydrolase/lipid-phosphate phosphatase